jgi:hypothetical protein
MALSRAAAGFFPPSVKRHFPRCGNIADRGKIHPANIELI